MGTEIRELEMHTAILKCEYRDQALNVRTAKATNENSQEWNY
jgi:hypothetical protein